MSFPRTTVAGISLPRMLIGTNWLLGWSHRSSSADAQIKERYASPKDFLPVNRGEIIMKKLVSVFLAVCLMAGLGTVGVQAAKMTYEEFTQTLEELTSNPVYVQANNDLEKLIEVLSPDEYFLLYHKVTVAAYPYEKEYDQACYRGDFDSALAALKNMIVIMLVIYEGELNYDVPEELWQLLGGRPENPPEPFWSTWPNWLQWLLRYFFFGFLWM